MLPSPSSSPRSIFTQATNLSRTPQSNRKIPFLPTPPTDGTRKAKRKTTLDCSTPPKRLKLGAQDSDESEESDTDVYYSDSDVEMDDAFPSTSRIQHRFAQSSHYPIPTRSLLNSRTITPSTLPVLRSFVSSQKSDVFKCHSAGEDIHLTPAYACAYSYGAKSGQKPLLAVATEQGTVHILDTTRRADWDVEPPRTTLQSHQNGVFAVKWRADDLALVTCSADYSLRVTDIATERITHVLQGHSSTVKCLALDPNNPNLLASGGRDGAICLWDLRVSEASERDELKGLKPTMMIHGAHEDTLDKSKRKVSRRKNPPIPRSVTSVLYPDSDPYGLVSSCSSNGILQYWDLRAPPIKKGRASKPKPPACLYSSSVDPTMLRGSRRPRGIVSLAAGTGPTRGLLFGLGADNQIHTYNLPHLAPQSSSYMHDSLRADTFYVGISVSACGRWLSCGSSGTSGSGYMFDVEHAGRLGVRTLEGVELRGCAGEAGVTDWAQDQLAVCSDDGTVRIWRPDVQVRRRCNEAPEDSKWDWLWAA